MAQGFTLEVTSDNGAALGGRRSPFFPYFLDSIPRAVLVHRSLAEQRRAGGCGWGCSGLGTGIFHPSSLAHSVHADSSVSVPFCGIYQEVMLLIALNWIDWKLTAMLPLGVPPPPLGSGAPTYTRFKKQEARGENSDQSGC